MVAATEPPRPVRTAKSCVWGGTRAKDMWSGKMFLWTSEHNEHFREFVRIHGSNARTTADLDPLLISLNLDGFSGIKTNNGEDVEALIMKKVKAKLYSTQRIMLGEGGGIYSTRKRNRGPTTTFTQEYQWPSCDVDQDIQPDQRPIKEEPRSDYDSDENPTNQTLLNPADGNSTSPFGGPTTPQQQQPSSRSRANPPTPDSATGAAHQGLPLTPFLKMPNTHLRSQEQQPCARRPGAPAAGNGRGLPDAVLDARKDKAGRVHSAWQQLTVTLLDVDQTPDDEYEDEEFFAITERLVRICRRTLKGEVDRLLALAKIQG